MKDLILKRTFLKISDEFRSDDFDLATVAALINEGKFKSKGKLFFENIDKAINL